jgi:hypothetical protein
MIQRRDRPRFVFESAQTIRVICHRRGEHFDGDVAIKTRIAGAVDFAHPASAERRDDFVRAEARTGRESQGFR